MYSNLIYKELLKKTLKQNNMSTGKIMDLLKQCEDHDKDTRFMGALDLCAEMIRLHEHHKIEEAMEKRICSAFIKHLNDTSLDV